MEPVMSFSQWLEARDSDLANTIQNEVDWSKIGQGIRHPIKAIRGGLQRMKAPFLNTMMAAPLAIGAIHSAIPEMPMPAYPAPIQRAADFLGMGGGEETPGEESPEEEGRGGVPGIDELAHYVAERLMKKIYELDYKMAQMFRVAQRSFYQWAGYISHLLIKSAQNINPQSLEQAAVKFFGQVAPNAIVSIVKATWEIIKEVGHKFIHEPPEPELSAKLGDVAAMRRRKIAPPDFYNPSVAGPGWRPPRVLDTLRGGRERVRTKVPRRPQMF